MSPRTPCNMLSMCIDCRACTMRFIFHGEFPGVPIPHEKNDFLYFPNLLSVYLPHFRGSEAPEIFAFYNCIKSKLETHFLSIPITRSCPSSSAVPLWCKLVIGKRTKSGWIPAAGWWSKTGQKVESLMQTWCVVFWAKIYRWLMPWISFFGTWQSFQIPIVPHPEKLGDNMRHICFGESPESLRQSPRRSQGSRSP